jgi:uncharacterized protein YlxW (UPF0749 family)
MMIILGAVFSGLIWVLISCATPSYVTHEKLQSEYSYEARKKDSEAFTLGSSREDLKTLKAKLRDLENRDNHNSKKAEIDAQIAELRKLISQLENK